LPFASGRHESHGVLRVGSRFGIEDEVCRVILGLKSGWGVVSISHPLGIVKTGGERQCMEDQEIREFPNREGDIGVTVSLKIFS